MLFVSNILATYNLTTNDLNDIAGLVVKILSICVYVVTFITLIIKLSVSIKNKDIKNIKKTADELKDHIDGVKDFIDKGDGEK
jgi:hypothetical protein